MERERRVERKEKMAGNSSGGRWATCIRACRATVSKVLEISFLAFFHGSSLPFLAPSLASSPAKEEEEEEKGGSIIDATSYGPRVEF